jgi:hypothetical protein
MYLTWADDQPFGQPTRIQHLGGDGVRAAGWPDSALRVNSTSTTQAHTVMATDGSGGVIAVWNELGGCCDRIGLFAQKFVTDGIVATALSLVNASATPELVTLLWSGVGAGGLAAIVERRTERTTWQTIGAAAPDGPDRLRFEDRSVEPGTRFAYRLSYHEDGTQRVTSEAWVEVPLALELALEGFRPNPASHPPVVRFTLPSAASASLELLDVSGRRVASHDLSAFGPGRHAIRLDSWRAPPGVYWMRLQYGERALLRRGVVAR